MYINPILVGVLATIGFEILAVVVFTLAGFVRFRKEHGDEDDD